MSRREIKRSKRGVGTTVESLVGEDPPSHEHELERRTGGLGAGLSSRGSHTGKRPGQECPQDVPETTRGAKAGMSQGLGTLRERWEPLKGWSRGRRGLNGIWAGGRGWGAAHRPFGPFRQCTGFCPSPASVKPVSTQSGECPNPGEEDSTVTAIVGSCIVAPILRTRERYLLWTKGACQCGKVGIEMGKIF